MWHWGQFYKNIYGMMPQDRPSDDVIEDDAELDRYLKQLERDRARKGGKAQGDARLNLLGGSPQDDIPTFRG